MISWLITMESRQKAAAESSALGAQWLLAHLKADGSFEGGTDLRAYYKTPAAFIFSGHVREAERLLDYISAHLLKSDGDLDGTGVPWYKIYRTYPHSWICCAAMMRGRFELARSLAGFISTFHDPLTGGFFADQNRTTQEIMTTSMAGLACLWAGDLPRAEAAAGWLETLFLAQPDLNIGLYTSWNNGLVTHFDEESAPSHFIDAAKPRQYYFQYGISAALLASLSGATGNRKWLALARAYLHASEHCFADRYTTPQSGKIGWGAAWTYRLTHRPEDVALTRAVINGLATMQNADGSWIASGAYGAEKAEADSAVIDITSEFTALQGAMGLVAGV